MVCLRSKIFGWRVKVNTVMLKTYRVKFQYEYQYHVLLEYIKRGDYRSNIPFGLYCFNKKYYVIATEKPEFLCIIDNPVQQFESIRNMDVKHGLSVYVLTFFHHLLVTLGYTRPIDVKSLIGRSKGVVSFRKTPVKTLEHNFFGRKVYYSFSKAERFETYQIGDSYVEVYYDPRYEISESFFNLTSVSLIPDNVQEEKKSLIRKFTQVEKRYQELSELLMNYRTEIITINELKEKKAHRIENLSFVLNNKLLNENFANTPYEQILKENLVFRNRVNEILVLIDNNNNAKDSSKLKHFLEEFERITHIKTIKHFFDDPQEIGDNKVGLIILDDTLEGCEWIYNSLKKKIFMASKVIKIRTIFNNPWDSIIILAWMALQFRMSNKLLLRMEKSAFDSVIALEIKPVLGGSWLVLTGTSLKDDSVISKISLFYNKRNEQIFTENNIEQFILELVNNKISKNILLISGNPELSLYLNEIAKRKFWDLVYLKESNSIFLSVLDSKTSIALDGLYQRISDKKYLLMTNGYPNKPEGIPKPIVVDIFQCKNSEKDIIQEIFALTFIHPMSLTKPKFPFPLTLARSNVTDVNLEMSEDFNRFERSKNAN